jgi:hypothetical protein
VRAMRGLGPLGQDGAVQLTGEAARRGGEPVG